MVHPLSAGTPTGAASDARFAPFLAASPAVDRDHPAVRRLAGAVRRLRDVDTMRVAYETVRDRYPHSMDIDAAAVSISASDVLRHGHGICFAKSHLLAAVLRACGIATGLAYQKLAGGERTYLHALRSWHSRYGPIRESMTLRKSTRGRCRAPSRRCAAVSRR